MAGRITISSCYELEFTNEELIKVMGYKDSGIHKNTVIKRTSRYNQVYEDKENIYSLNEKVRQKCKNNENNSLLCDVINEYIKLNENIVQSAEQIESLLKRFLYNIFNTNKETLMRFLKGERIILEEKDKNDFSEEDKILINNFLNWDNKEKNELVFLASSYCVEYCMLTVKKDFSSYKDVFKGKSFYLDSNVIFRLAGINNEERRIVTKSFVNKCMEQGIAIKYTNFTYEELKETIKRHVDGIKKLLKGKKMVSVNNYQTYVNPFTNLDFIKLYDQWVKKPNTQYNDYEAFQKYIMKNIDDILCPFKRMDFISYEARDKEFGSYNQNLRNYKSSRNAHWTDKSINIDINNYLYMYNLRNKSTGKTFVDIADYFISTDGNLCEWGKEILPCIIPIAVLPSVWHSLILKFNGRTNDDYKAFSLFLNLRYRVTENDFDKRRPNILGLVQGLDEPVELKNMILEDITDKLSMEYENNFDVEEIVEKSKNEVLERERKRIYENEGKPLVDAGIEKGKIEAIMCLADVAVDKKFKTIDHLINFFNFLKIISGFILVIVLIYFVYKIGLKIIPNTLDKEILGYDIMNWISFGELCFLVIVYLIINPCKKFLEKYDRKKLYDTVYQKLLNDIDKKNKK